MPDITPQRQPICYTCGSPLIQISKKTEQSGTAFAPDITFTEYRCSNKECQEEKDRQEEARIKLKAIKDKEKEERLASKIKK